MTGWAVVIATLAWLIGVIVLGFDWRGHERSPGVWADGVSLAQWAACWILLAVLGVGGGRMLRRWSVRLLTLTPLLAWIAWELRGSTLGPIPMVIYICPTVLAWCLGLTTGTLVRRWLARSVNGW
jgi:hypothetical protein